MKRLIVILLPFLLLGLPTTSVVAEKGMEKSSRLAELDFDAPFPPALLFSTLLNEGIRLHQNGELQYGDITAIFLPTKTKSGEAVSYGLEDEHFSLTTTIYDASDNVIATMAWDSPAYRVSSSNPWFRTIHPTTERTGDISKMKPGEYRIEFLVEGDLFYVFPFSVVELVKGDPYSPEKIYGINGAWNDYGYIYIADNIPERPFRWKQWLRNENPNPAVTSHTPTITGVVKRNGTVIGTLPKISYNLKRAWTRFDFGFDNSEGYPLKGGDILGVDGTYEISMTVDGTTSVYSFDVQGGAIRHQGRQVREETEPVDFIEGGRDAWWVPKK